jgi:NADH dehydrogenase FAD-containing subunit
VPLVQRAKCDLVLAEVNGLDLENRRLHFKDREPIGFDLMSIGVGSMPVGWDKHSSPMMVPIKPMQTFLSRLDQRFKAVAASVKRPLNIAIVGGGAAGIEIAFCLQARLASPPFSNGGTIQIFTSGDRVGDGLRSRTVRRIEKLLSRRGIAVRQNCRVNQLTDTQLFTDDGRQHDVDCVVWATGAGSPPVLSTLGLKTDERGFIATSDTLQSLTDDHIFAVGDSGTIIDSPCPKAGVYAVRQCPILWNNLQALTQNKPLMRYRPQGDFLKLLNTGDGKALLEYKPFTIHAGWCWALKCWIDKRFIQPFQGHSVP